MDTSTASNCSSHKKDKAMIDVNHSHIHKIRDQNMQSGHTSCPLPDTLFVIYWLDTSHLMKMSQSLVTRWNYITEVDNFYLIFFVFLDLPFAKSDLPAQMDEFNGIYIRHTRNWNCHYLHFFQLKSNFFLHSIQDHSHKLFLISSHGWL